jgi:hypothetical protein
MTKDSGNGMKIVGAIILFCLAFYTVATFVVYIADDWRTPSFSSAAVPATRAH